MLSRSLPLSFLPLLSHQSNLFPDTPHFVCSCDSMDLTMVAYGTVGTLPMAVPWENTSLPSSPTITWQWVPMERLNVGSQILCGIPLQTFMAVVHWFPHQPWHAQKAIFLQLLRYLFLVHLLQCSLSLKYRSVFIDAFTGTGLQTLHFDWPLEPSLLLTSSHSFQWIT